MSKQNLWYRIPEERRISAKSYFKQVHKARMFVVAGLAVSFAIFIAIALIGGFSKVINVILSSNLYLYGLAFVLVLTGYIFRFGKWDYYLSKLKLKIAPKTSMSVYLSLYSMEITPGRLGRLLVAYTLSKITNIKVAKIVPLVTLDIFTDFLGVAILAFATALLFHKYLLYVTVIDIVLMIPFLIILNRWFFDQIKRIFKQNNIIKLLTRHGEAYYISQSKLNAPKVYVISLLFTIPSEILNGFALYLSLLAIGIKPQVLASQFIYSSTQIFGMITGSPGNLGVTDATLVALIGSTYHLNIALSSAVAIMMRLATLWLMTIVGTIFLIYSLRYWKHGKKKS